MEVNVSNQKDYTTINKVDDKYSFDEETEFLLEEYNQSSANDINIVETSDEKIQYEGVKVNVDILYPVLKYQYIINYNLVML